MKSADIEFQERAELWTRDNHYSQCTMGDRDCKNCPGYQGRQFYLGSNKVCLGLKKHASVKAYCHVFGDFSLNSKYFKYSRKPGHWQNGLRSVVPLNILLSLVKHRWPYINGYPKIFKSFRPPLLWVTERRPDPLGQYQYGFVCRPVGSLGFV